MASPQPITIDPEPLREGKGSHEPLPHPCLPHSALSEFESPSFTPIFCIFVILCVPASFCVSCNLYLMRLSLYLPPLLSLFISIALCLCSLADASAKLPATSLCHSCYLSQAISSPWPPAQSPHSCISIFSSSTNDVSTAARLAAALSGGFPFPWLHWLQPCLEGFLSYLLLHKPWQLG